jgi:hypothetical protein
VYGFVSAAAGGQALWEKEAAFGSLESVIDYLVHQFAPVLPLALLS